MRKVHLHGALGKKYGKVFELEVRTAGEAIRALAANFPKFLKDIRAGSWHVVRGEKVDKGLDLGRDDISGFNLGKGDLHIVPVVAGSKRAGLLKVVLGAVLIGAAFVLTAGAAAGLAAPILGGGGLLGGITGTNLALFGAAMALAGVSSLLTPEEKKKEDSDDSSFTMTGPGNTADQGVPVPLVYGEVITGGVMVSGGYDVERIAVTGNGGGSVGSGGKK
jgi:predicted phage tail protein